MASKKENKGNARAVEQPVPKPKKGRKAEGTPESDGQSPEGSNEPPESRDENGRFKKGRQKTGGRKLGTKNKYGNVRDRLKEQLEPFIDRLGEMILIAEKEDGAAAALNAMEKFMPYFTPKFSSVQIGADQDRPLSEEEALMEMDAKYQKKEMEISIKSLTIVDNDKLTDDFDPDDDPGFDMGELDVEG